MRSARLPVEWARSLDELSAAIDDPALVKAEPAFDRSVCARDISVLIAVADLAQAVIRPKLGHQLRSEPFGVTKREAILREVH